MREVSELVERWRSRTRIPDPRPQRARPRPRFEVECEQCGQMFGTSRPDVARTCSARCRQARSRRHRYPGPIPTL